MSACAQTNLQLYRELADSGYSHDAIGRVGAAYRLAMRLFTGQYRGSGKPFLAHLVGTASILVSLHAPVGVVIAGMLHAAYERGEFGNGWRGPSARKRATVRSVVGEDVEDLVARYTALRWNERALADSRRALPHLAERERTALLIRMANELEDHLDLGVLYCADAERRRRYARECGPGMAEIADGLGFPELGTRLRQAMDAIATADVPVGLGADEAGSFLLPPPSHRRRMRIVLSHLIARRP